MAKKISERDPNDSLTPARRRSIRVVPRSTAGDEQPRRPTHDEIAEAAYRRYLSRGSVHGRDFDDWLEAERELRSRTSQ
jgi:hypothetical protein